jgi:hypothetical protein
VATQLPVAPTDVEYGNGRFVAIGAHVELGAGTAVTSAYAYVSEDGRDWTEVRLPDGLLAMYLAFGDGVFVAPGNGTFLRSTDGLTWSPMDAPAPRVNGGLEFAAGVFVTLGGGGFAYTDGAWQPIEVGPPEYDPFDLRVVNGAFVGRTIARSERHDDNIPDLWGSVSSSDGLTWTVEEQDLTEPPPLVVIDADAVCVAFSDPEVMSGPDCDTLEVTYADRGFRPEDALHVDGLYLVGGIEGILSSRDGMTWTTSLGSE